MKKLIAITLALTFSFAPLAHAAIAFDVSADGGTSSGVTTLSWNHTVTGANTLLLACVWSFTSGDNVSTVTYNGTGMTQLTKRAGDASSELYLYYYIGAPTGSHTITVTTIGTGQLFADSISYTGVSPYSFPDASGSGTAAGTTRTLTLTTVAANAWMTSCSRTPTANPSASAPTVLRQQNSSSADAAVIFDNGPLVTPGSNSIVFTNGLSFTSYDIFASFAPATTTASNRFGLLSFFGWF